MKGILDRQAHRASERVLVTEGSRWVGLQGHAHGGIPNVFAQEGQMAKERGEGEDKLMVPVDHGMGTVPGKQGVRMEKEHAALVALGKHHGVLVASERMLEQHKKSLHKERVL